MKKFFAILLTLVLCASMLSVTALASGTAYLTTEGKYTVNAGAGNTVTVNVYLNDNPGIGSMRFGFNYDATLLTLQSVQGVGMMGGTWTINDYALWDNGGDSNFNGQILQLTFALTDAAKPGDVTNVSVYCLDAWSFNNGEVTINGVGATVEVICNHKWELTSTKPHTCTEDGEELYTCSICGETKTEVIPAAHTFDETVWDHDEFGHWHNCKFCDATCCEEDHKWVETGRDPAQPGKAGTIYKACSTCGRTDTETIPALPDDFPDEPQVGDIRPLMLAGFSAVLFTLAAVAYVFKRKFVK